MKRLVPAEGFRLWQIFPLLLVLACVVDVQREAARAQFAVGGVYIDADGVLRQAGRLAPDERLKLLRAEVAEQPLAGEIASASPLRKISLRRLEQTVKDLGAAERPFPADVRYLAGLQAIRYVFVYPESGDVVLAGPAESWRQLRSGEVVGRQSNRPVLHLDDLIVALRFAFPGNQRFPFIGCSIEPTSDGVKNYAAYMRRLGRIDRSRLKQIFSGMEQAMGLQAIKLYGVPGSSRFALKMVAADYRLKRIALGHDPSPVRQVTNYLDLAAKRNIAAARRPHRWWFVGDYDAILHSPDQLAFELRGQAVKVVTAPTLPSTVAKGGKTAKPSAAASQFAQSFTKHLSNIAAKVPVFAELQNLISLTVAAELIAQTNRANVDANSRASTAPATALSNDPPVWKPTCFLDRAACALQKHPVPSRVPSMANFRLARGRHWIISVSGGVEIDPRTLTGREFRKESTDRNLIESRIKHQRPKQMERWWWD